MFFIKNLGILWDFPLYNVRGWGKGEKSLVCYLQNLTKSVTLIMKSNNLLHRSVFHV
jgi:hypothetical protein